MYKSRQTDIPLTLKDFLPDRRLTFIKELWIIFKHDGKKGSLETSTDRLGGLYRPCPLPSLTLDGKDRKLSHFDLLKMYRIP